MKSINIWSRLYLATVQRHPRAVLIILALCVIGLAIQIPKLRFDASSDSLVVEGDHALALYRDVGKRYNTEDFLVVAYTPQQILYSQSVLDRIASLQQELKALAPVSSINSILNVPLLYSPKVFLSNLSEEINYLSEPSTDRKLAAQEFKASPIYKGLLTSDDAKTTVLQVNLKRQQILIDLRERRDALRQQQREGELGVHGEKELNIIERDYERLMIQTGAADKQLISDVRTILDKYRSDAQVFLGGVTMITNDMLSFIKQDLSVFGTAIFLFIVVVLGALFKEWRWVILSILACVACVVLTTGLMALFGWKLTVISANFVALLLILTLSVVVHQIVFYRELEVKKPELSVNERVIEMVYVMFEPCVYTTLTTLVAFASLVVSGIRPMIDFGWMMTLGVSIALLVSFIIMPAGILLWKHTATKQLDESIAQTPPITGAIANFTERFANPIFGVTALLVVVSIYGISLLKVDNRFIDYFDKDTEIYKGMETIDAKLGGVIPLDIIIRKKSEATNDADAVTSSGDDFADVHPVAEVSAAKTADSAGDDFADVANDDNNAVKPSYWFTQAGLDEVKRVHKFIDDQEETGKTQSLATLYQVAEDLLGMRVDDIQLALLQQKMGGQMKAAMVDPYLDAANNEARISVRIKETSRSLNRNELIQRIDKFLHEDMGYAKEQYDLTGLFVLYNNMLQSLFRSQILTMGTVFATTLAMFLVLFRSLSVSLIALFANILAAALVLGCMGILRIPLDMMTITIAAITIGIGVDNAIHYIHRFKVELLKDGDYLATMHRTHRTIGRAVFYTSVTIIVGFSILVLSNFTPSIYFGFLTAFAMSAALLGNLLLLPQLLIKFKPYGKQGALHHAAS